MQFTGPSIRPNRSLGDRGNERAGFGKDTTVRRIVIPAEFGAAADGLSLPPGPHAGVHLGAVRAAAGRARRLLWQTQRGDGSWDAPCDLGPSCTAQALVALHFAGRL